MKTVNLVADTAHAAAVAFERVTSDRAEPLQVRSCAGGPRQTTICGALSRKRSYVADQSAPTLFPQTELAETETCEPSVSIFDRHKSREIMDAFFPATPVYRRQAQLSAGRLEQLSRRKTAAHSRPSEVVLNDVSEIRRVSFQPGVFVCVFFFFSYNNV